ncbi:hypothetical protein BGU71_19275, partial [Clostridioides difficile]
QREWWGSSSSGASEWLIVVPVLHRAVGDVVNAPLMGTFPSSVEPCPSHLARALTRPEWPNGAGERGGSLGG